MYETDIIINDFNPGGFDLGMVYWLLFVGFQKLFPVLVKKEFHVGNLLLLGFHKDHHICTGFGVFILGKKAVVHFFRNSG